jgi:hypothetical protein
MQIDRVLQELRGIFTRARQDTGMRRIIKKLFES